MKKTLFSTTALATAGLLAASAGDAFGQAAAPAAEKMKLSLGGYTTQYVGWAEQDSDFERANSQHYKKFDQKADSEVYFLGSLTLDNGITLSVRADLEIDTQNNFASAGNHIDESYLNIGSTTLGTLTLGGTNPAGSDLLVQGPAVGLLNFYNTDMNAWLVDAGGTVPTGVSTGLLSSGGTDDNLVKYISPSLAGFRLGASYEPDTADTSAQPTVSATSKFETGVQWAGTFGDFGLRASAIYVKSQGASDAAQQESFGVGGDVTFADFSFGGSYGEQSNDGNLTIATGTSNANIDNWNIGVAYNPGPFAVGLTYGRRTAEVTAADTDDSTYSKWALGATYILGPGVTTGAQLIRANGDNETNAQATENTAWAVVGGIKIDF